ncbi:MAG: LptF/LptG family permease, partial [Flavisolibacter sp.]
VKAFIGPFIATFFITLIVLIMQFFWLWVDDFVGKGVSTGILLEFIWFQSAVLVPLALPLSVLLSSIMTFGNLGESYELVAIKSAGISLLRFMRPLLMVTILICGVAFLFSNYIIPVANLKSRTLLADIVNAKPSFDLKEGVFYDKIPNFSIKVGKKQNDSVINNIIIYEQTNPLQDNFIIANNGVMRSSPNKRYLEFILRNGWRYEERGNSPNTQYIRLGFKEYKKQFDISSLGLNQRTDEKQNAGNARMLSMRQLTLAIDSIRKLNGRIGERVKSDVLNSLSFINYLDSNWKSQKVNSNIKKFDEVIPDSIAADIRQKVISKLTNVRISNEIALTQYKDQQKSLRQHQIEWHRKIALSAACLVLFLIGAPLGSIIRKGGLGSPLIFAIVFFMVFYFSSTTGEKFAKEGSLAPFTGMWLSTFVLLPIGLFLIYKARRDSQLFNKEVYFRIFRKLTFQKKA